MGRKLSFQSRGQAGRTNVAVIGCAGFNVKMRIAELLHGVRGRINVVGYDLRAPDPHWADLPFVRVGDDAELAHRLASQRPTDVLIETTDQDHSGHIRIARASGAQRIYCEKMIAESSDKLPDTSEPADAADARVWIVDHYMLLPAVRLVLANTPAWLGQVRRLRVSLLETQGVPEPQVSSHRLGMQNFFHHVAALASQWFDVDDLVPVEAEWVLCVVRPKGLLDPAVMRHFGGSQLAVLLVMEQETPACQGFPRIGRDTVSHQSAFPTDGADRIQEG